MKRLIITMVAVLIALSMSAQKVRMSVNVKQPGTLAICIGEKNKNSVEKLTIKGLLNRADVIFLREMAGRDSIGNEVEETRLKSVNLRKVTFEADTTCFVKNSVIGDVLETVVQTCLTISSLVADLATSFSQKVCNISARSMLLDKTDISFAP
jgi:hypothetical protein